MADNLFDMMVFVRVVEAGSLSGAARELHMSLAVISRKLARLEERLGVRLINRTTRTLALTEEGATFHVHCVRILAEIEEAETKSRAASKRQQVFCVSPRRLPSDGGLWRRCSSSSRTSMRECRSIWMHPTPSPTSSMAATIWPFVSVPLQIRA